MNDIANQNSAATAIGDRVDSGLGPKNPTVSTNRRVALPRDAVESTVSTLNDKPKNRNPKPADNPKSDKVERVIVGIVLFVLAAVPLLTFLFSFGNVGDLGTSLGIDRRIAYLTGPAVDLTATGMIVAATWLSYRGMSERELWRVHALSIICALIMFALNCGPSMYVHRYQLAGFSAVGPFLLMAMGFVGPWLLRQLTDTRTAPARHKPDRGTAQAAPATVPAKTEPARGTAPSPGTNPPASGTASGTSPGTAPPAVPARIPTVPANVVPPNPGTRTQFESWVERAVPLWNAYIDKHHERPIAAVLGNQVRMAHPEPNAPASERWDRKLRAAVREAVGDTDDEHAQAEAVS
jgi:hypothetical protein